MSAIVSEKNALFSLFSHKKAHMTKFDLTIRQSRVIIFANYYGPESSMLHTKFPGNRSIGFGEEDFLRVIPYMGLAATLVMWPSY